MKTKQEKVAAAAGMGGQRSGATRPSAFPTTAPGGVCVCVCVGSAGGQVLPGSNLRTREGFLPQMRPLAAEAGRRWQEGPY